ncbi:hypothetical protein DL767_000048 [Monosporascus sp. MG133]|nr:hypothetical protein DL767_000048 [Monosporascus sp. MG133]
MAQNRTISEGDHTITHDAVPYILRQYGHASPRTVRAAPAGSELRYFKVTPDDHEEPADYGPLEPYRELAKDDDDDDDDIPALEFDLRDRRELERKTRRLEEAKERWRRVREGIGAAIALIPERLRLRREFREEFNSRWAAFE